MTSSSPIADMVTRGSFLEEAISRWTPKGRNIQGRAREKDPRNLSETGEGTCDEVEKRAHVLEDIFKVVDNVLKRIFGEADEGLGRVLGKRKLYRLPRTVVRPTG